MDVVDEIFKAGHKPQHGPTTLAHQGWIAAAPYFATLFRPALFARYSALSAAFTTASGVAAFSVRSATPILTVTERRRGGFFLACLGGRLFPGPPDPPHREPAGLDALPQFLEMG